MTNTTPTFPRLERAVAKLDAVNQRLLGQLARRNDAIIRLKALGMPTAEISAKLGFKVPQTVANVLAETPGDTLEGVDRGEALKRARAAQSAIDKILAVDEPAASAERDACFFELYEAGVQQGDIAVAAGVSSNIVRKGRQRHTGVLPRTALRLGEAVRRTAKDRRPFTPQP